MVPQRVTLLSSREARSAPDLQLSAYLYLPAHTTTEPLWPVRAARPPGEAWPPVIESPVAGQPARETPSGTTSSTDGSSPCDATGSRAPGLVVAHGAGSRALRHEEFCLQARRHGSVVLALDFRGHGGSSGVADRPLHLDILAAVRFLRDHPAVDRRLVCFRGSSMGGFYGLKAAPRAGFAAMALLCPASEATMFKAVAETGATTDRRDTEADGLATHGDATAAPWDIPRTRSFFEGEDSLTLAEAVDCPVLVVHARDDEIVPPSHSLTLVHHLRPEALLLVLEGGTHTTAQHSPWVHQYTAGWLKRTARLQPVLRLPVAE